MPAPPGGQGDLQTFYMAQSSPNLIFHADDVTEVWVPARNIYLSGHDTLVSPIALGPGAIYTVRSDVDTPTAAQLEAETGTPASTETPAQARQLEGRSAASPSLRPGEGPGREDHGLQADHRGQGPGPRSPGSAHTHYSTDIPPLPPGQDTVDEFLFGNRTGFCEQISTAMAVMLRSIGIPAREAVGYVPGSYNPITDLYEVQGKDAHAWVQVWFARYGWQSFDPTAVVPLANPSPGATLSTMPAVPCGPCLSSLSGSSWPWPPSSPW